MRVGLQGEIGGSGRKGKLWNLGKSFAWDSLPHPLFLRACILLISLEIANLSRWLYLADFGALVWTSGKWLVASGEVVNTDTPTPGCFAKECGSD